MINEPLIIYNHLVNNEYMYFIVIIMMYECEKIYKRILLYN